MEKSITILPVAIIVFLNTNLLKGCEPLSRDGLRFPRINGQLYFVDPVTAQCEREMNPIYKSMDVKENILRSLDAMLRRDHVLAKLYKTAKEQYDDAQIEATLQGLENLPNFRITLLNPADAPEKIVDKKLHDRQVNLPLVQEIAAIHCSNVDDPPPAQGVKLTSRDGQISLLYNDHMLCDAATYPLLYPYGSIGFHRHILKSLKRSNTSKGQGNPTKFISKRQYFSSSAFFIFILSLLRIYIFTKR